MDEIHVYLVSDSTGETVCNVARSVLAHFEGLIVEEHIWTLLRNKKQLDKLKSAIIKQPGIVMYTIINKDIVNDLKKICLELNILCIAVLSPIIDELSKHFNAKLSTEPGRQYQMDEDYFTRVNAINYAIMHDDGQSLWSLNEANIILVGVSRTSKSPTCMYLAYRGYKVANVPFISKEILPEILFQNISAKKILIVGLTISVERLVQIRKNRIISMNDVNNKEYVDEYKIKNELIEANKIFTKNGWPIIDVTKKSVEEVSANILKLYESKKFSI